MFQRNMCLKIYVVTDENQVSDMGKSNSQPTRPLCFVAVCPQNGNCFINTCSWAHHCHPSWSVVLEVMLFFNEILIKVNQHRESW